MQASSRGLLARLGLLQQCSSRGLSTASSVVLEQSAAAGHSSHEGDWRQQQQQQPAHQQQHQHQQQRRPWQERQGGGGGPQRQYQQHAHAFKSRGTDNYHPPRASPKYEQRLTRTYPVCLYNVGPSLQRDDVAAFFDGFNLASDEVRPQYSWHGFTVQRFWLNFASLVDRERAMTRHTAYLGTRRALLRKATPREFSEGVYNPLAMSSRGRYLLVDNLASTATSEDIVRFFSGFDLHAKSVSFLRDSENNVRLRSRHLNVTEKAFVRFTSPLEAHRAVRERQGGFVGSNQLRLRVLQ